MPMFDEQFHLESIQEYLDAWRNPDVGARLEISAEYAAYQLLVHSGEMARQRVTGDCGLPACLAEMTPSERVRLVRSACGLMAGFSFHGWYHELFNRECLDLDELAEAYELLMQRDAWDAALWMAGKAVDDQLETDEALLSDLALAHSAAAAFDEELFKHPDVVAGGLHILDDEPGIQRIGPWFERAKELDREFNDPTLAEVFAAASRSGINRSIQRRPLAELLLISDQDTAMKAEYRLAASSQQSRLAVAEAKRLQQSERPVAGDRSITVRFWPDRNTGECKRWRLELIGGVDEMKEYVSAEIDFGDGGTRAATFSLDVATFELNPDDLRAEVSAALVTVRGERRTVLLNESPNGGH